MSGTPELVTIIQGIARERDIDPEVLFESLEIAMEAAARKKYLEAEDVEVSIDRLNGSIQGIRDGSPIDPAELGRIAAQTAKQVMMQKFREAEQDVIYDDFIERKGTMVTGTLQRFEGENIIVDLNKTEAIMPRHERVRTETYNVGDRIRANIVDVRKVGHRVRIVLSRTHPDLVRRLFELEIPEIAEHIIEIKGIAREAGHRTKLAVVSYDSKVDCVGACVGIRGSRIRNIIDELNGEKIDIIRWNDSPELLIMNSLKPAEILSITLDDETVEAVVTVAEDQLSLAIGKRGQNVRLAARLTGWDVRIVSPGAEKKSGPGSSPPADADMSAVEKRVLDQLRGEEIAAKNEAESDADPLLDMARQAISNTPREIPVEGVEAPVREVAAEEVAAEEVAAEEVATEEVAAEEDVAAEDVPAENTPIVEVQSDETLPETMTEAPTEAVRITPEVLLDAAAAIDTAEAAPLPEGAAEEMETPDVERRED